MSSMRGGSHAWGIPSGSIARQGSTDASLFSSSLPVFPHEKLQLTDSDHGVQSVDDTSPELSKIKDAMDDLDLPEIGVLLPDDEDELLAGITDGFDLSGLPRQVEEMEEYDIFDSGGGMELESDIAESVTNGLAKTSISDGYIVGNAVGPYGLSNGVGTVAGEHPYGEHPSRTLFVRNINSNVEDSELRSLFEHSLEEFAEVEFNPTVAHSFDMVLCPRCWPGAGHNTATLRLHYGAIRTLYTACKHRGFVMISYYDIRAARTAMRALQNKPLRRRKLDIHFSIPKDNPSDKDLNQGTLVVFNLDPSVTNDDLLKIFGAYGEVKEIRETPHKKHHKFIEYYDVRAAEAALRSLNRIDIAGKRIKLEPSRPGGARRNMIQQLTQEMEQDDTRSYRHQTGSPITNSPPGSWAQFSISSENSLLQNLSRSPTAGVISPGSNRFSGLATSLPSLMSNPVKIAPIGKDQWRVNHADQVFSNGTSSYGVPIQHSQSFPEHENGMIGSSPRAASSFGPSISNASGMGTLTGPQFLWGRPTPYSENSQSSAAWQTLPVGHLFTPNSHGQGQGKGIPYSSRHASLLTSSQNYHHHVGSAPPGIPLERQYGYFPESPEASFMSPVAFGGIGSSRNDGGLSINMVSQAPINPAVSFPRNIPENVLPNFRMMSSQRVQPNFYGNTPYSGLGSIGFESPVDRGRARRLDTYGSLLDSKKQYQLDLERIANGEDTRTTLMIKNIPNKYTSKMLLAAIDETHMGTYDFLYLPIDFKNKCNVGYAFINMISHSHIVSFYEAFDGKKWGKFNSEKVASLAYARIQGKSALVTHFQNSSLMNEDKRCRPILFNSQGPESGDQETFLSSGAEQEELILGTSPESPTEKILSS